MELKGDGNTNCSWCTWNGPQKLGKGTGRIGNQRKNRDQQDYRFVEIGQDTEKSPGNLRRLAVIQTPMKDHQETLV